MPILDYADMIALCRRIAQAAHAGQTRALTDASLFQDHIVPVAELVRDFVPAEFNPRARCIAYLHDVIEDCDEIDGSVLRERGVLCDVVQEVEVLTHRDREPYTSYLSRVRAYCSPQGLYAKLFDVHQNRQALFDLGYPDKHRQRGDKYGLAIMALQEELARRQCDPLIWIPSDHTRLLRPA